MRPANTVPGMPWSRPIFLESASSVEPSRASTAEKCFLAQARFFREGTLPLLGALLHLREDLLQNRSEQGGRQGSQALQNCLGRDRHWSRSEESFLIEDAHRFPDGTDVSPQKREHEGDHDRQVEYSLSQS